MRSRYVRGRKTAFVFTNRKKKKSYCELLGDWPWTSLGSKCMKQTDRPDSINGQRMRRNTCYVRACVCVCVCVDSINTHRVPPRASPWISLSLDLNIQMCLGERRRTLRERTERLPLSIKHWAFTLQALQVFKLFILEGLHDMANPNNQVVKCCPHIQGPGCLLSFIKEGMCSNSISL